MDFKAKWVKCPFYKDSKGDTRIFCEGVEKGMSTQLYCSSPSQFNSYIKKHCCNDYKSCLIAQALYKKWEEVEKSETATGTIHKAKQIQKP